jgi:hypothetical protein
MGKPTEAQEGLETVCTVHLKKKAFQKGFRHCVTITSGRRKFFEEENCGCKEKKRNAHPSRI